MTFAVDPADRVLEADVVIVGAGPGGAAAAIKLAEAGRRVVVVDKARFPRDKICGDGLTTGALRLMEDLGVAPKAIASWMPVYDIHVGGPKGHTVTFPLPRDRGEYAVVARRVDVDNALVERAREAGATLIEGASIEAVDDADGCVTATFRQTMPAKAPQARSADRVAATTAPATGETHPDRVAATTAPATGETHPDRVAATDDGAGAEGVRVAATTRAATEGGEVFTVRARYLIAADGMWSPTRKLLGTSDPGYLGEWHAFRQYFSNVGPEAKDLWVWFEADLLPGYVWSFPLPDGGANVGFGIQRGGKVATKEMKALWPDILARPHIRKVLGPEAVPADRHQAWPIPARVDDVRLAEGRVLWVGDAAAATDPMTGEGIGQALLTGILAADAVLRCAPGMSGRSRPSPTHGSTPREAADVRSRYEAAVQRELVPDHKMSVLLVRALKHRKGARAAIRVAGLTPWTRRNFARWLFEDEPRAVALTPRRWHRGFLSRDGAYASR